jgi:hypothetical protein
MSKKPSKQTFVVLHVEIMGGDRPGWQRADEMVFHVASSLRKAERYVQDNHGVEPYSWWEIISIPLDKLADYEHVGHYSHTGKKLKEAPYKKAAACYDRASHNPKHHLYRGCCSNLTDRLFPKLKKGKWCYFGLAEETHLIVEAMPKNPFLDPHMQESYVQAYQRMHRADYSWGGFLEDRTVVMTGQYQKPGEVIHLGVDYNVPVGTEVSVPLQADLMYSFQDPDQDGGWGGKLIFKCQAGYFILGHLTSIVDDRRGYNPGEIVGKVADCRSNGNWYPHLHLQCLSQKAMDEHGRDVDGYGPMYKGIEKDFPNPEYQLVMARSGLKYNNGKWTCP